MKKFRALAGLVLVASASCINRAEEAAEYNDCIIDYETQIMHAFDQLDSLFASPKGNEDELDYTFTNLHAKIKMSKLALDSIGPFRRDPTLQKAARELFQELDVLVDTDFRKLVLMVKLPDSLRVQPAMADSLDRLRSRIESHMNELVSNFILTQNEFGKKYNIIFE